MHLRLYNVAQGKFGKCQLLQEITNNVKAIKSYGANIGNNHTPLIWDDEWE